MNFKKSMATPASSGCHRIRKESSRSARAHRVGSVPEQRAVSQNGQNAADMTQQYDSAECCCPQEETA